MNGVDSGMLEEDLHVVLRGCGQQEEGGVSAWPDSIMLPKCESVEHLRQVSAWWETAALLAGKWQENWHVTSRQIVTFP